MTLNEISYRILELYRANVKDSDPMDIRLIKNWVRTTRNKLIKQKLSQSFSAIPDSITQSLGDNIEIEEIDSSIIPNLSANCSLFRSKIKIPRTIDIKGIGHSFSRVGPADRLTEHYEILSLEKVIRFGYGRFNNNGIVAFILDDRIYIYTKGSMVFIPQYIDVIGVFEDPITAGKISDSNYGDDSLYPISESMVDDLEAMISDRNIKLTISRLEDKVENNEHKVE